MAAPLLNFEIPPETLKGLEQDLTPDQLKRALYGIVTRVQSKLVTAIRTEVKSENPFIKKKYLDRVIKKLKPQGNPPVGAVIVNNKRLPLIAFKVSASASKGVTVTLAKDLPPIVLKHAFLATVEAGANDEHTGIFLRKKGVPGSLYQDRKGRFSRFTPAGFAGRNPIAQEFGPGILKIVEIPEVLKRIEFDTLAEIKKQAASQFDRFLEPKSAPAADPSDASE